MGDPAGIGGELTLRRLARPGREASGGDANRHLVVLDDPDGLEAQAKSPWTGRAGADIAAPRRRCTVHADALPVLPVSLAAAGHPGRPNPANAAVIDVDRKRHRAVPDRARLGGMVTNPINKAALYDAGFAYPGHTEFLAALTGASGKQIMMLASPDLRVVPVTVHASLRNSIAMLTTEIIVAAARTTAAALRRDFGLARPRLAIAGLNPHAGEQGALGDEETTIIGPPSPRCAPRGLMCPDPGRRTRCSPPTARSRYDVAICMYHDQALIPLKTLDMDHGVNVTLGLPIVRTSPDHGTAYDIAGKGIADPSSLIAAIKLAAELARRRHVLDGKIPSAAMTKIRRTRTRSANCCIAIASTWMRAASRTGRAVRERWRVDRALSHGAGTGGDRRVAASVGAAAPRRDALRHELDHRRDGARQATAQSNYLVMVEGPDGPVPSVCGTYADVLVEAPGGWRFRRRELIHAFKGEMRLTLPPANEA